MGTENEAMKKNVPLTVVNDKHATTSQDWEDSSVIKEQQQPRRLFSISQLFAFSLTYMSLWQGTLV